MFPAHMVFRHAGWDVTSRTTNNEFLARWLMGLSWVPAGTRHFVCLARGEMVGQIPLMKSALYLSLNNAPGSTKYLIGRRAWVFWLLLGRRNPGRNGTLPNGSGGGSGQWRASDIHIDSESLLLLTKYSPVALWCLVLQAELDLLATNRASFHP